MVEPFMPTAEMTDDMLINTGSETITWGELQARELREKQIAVIDAVISMYHTTRLTSDFGEHILSKPIVQRAFAAIS